MDQQPTKKLLSYVIVTTLDIETQTRQDDKVPEPLIHITDLSRFAY